MAKAILSRFKWEIAETEAKKNSTEVLAEYEKLNGAIFEGTNEEVERYPKYLAILDKIKETKKQVKKAKKPIKKKKK